MISPELLRRFSLFAGVDPAIHKEIAMMAEEVDLQEDDWLFEKGDEADSIFFVVSGRVELAIDFPESGTLRDYVMDEGVNVEYQDLTTLVEGDLVGWSALVAPHEYTLGAYAKTKSKVVRIDSNKLRAFMADNPATGYQITHQLARALGNRLSDLRVQFISLVLEQK